VASALLAFSAGCDSKPQGKPLVSDGPSAPELAFESSADSVERAPIALTASDGAGLALVSVRARTVIEDPLAFTELQLTFRNPEPRRREGRFEITLPQRAAISRFAMQVADGELQEGEIVERKRAQQIYEDFLHRKQDPALLEQAAGNQFAARVFPIEAHEDKLLVLSYSEELTERDAPYRVLLQGLPTLNELDVEVQVGSGGGTQSQDEGRAPLAKLTLKKQGFAPTGDLELRLPAQRPVALRNGELVVARVVAAPDPAKTVEPVNGLTVLFDTSASRALGFGAQIDRLSALLAELRRRSQGDFELRVVAFDQAAQEIYRGAASAFGEDEQNLLLERDALGASDLAQALDFLARQPVKLPRLIVMGDGVVTAGHDSTTALREAAAKLAAHGVRRIDAIAEGGIQDRSTLEALCRAGLPSAGVVVDARASVDHIANKLIAPTRERVEVHIAGASWVHPSVLEGVQPGDEHLVLAEVPAGVPVQIELVNAGAEAFETIEAPRPLLERAVARGKIEQLERELHALSADQGDARASLEQKIVALSREQRVLSELTALLVLENEGDYRRYGIAQDALANILTVGEQGIELTRSGRLRERFGYKDLRPEPPPPTAEIAAEVEGEPKGRDEEGRAVPESSAAERRRERAIGGPGGPATIGGGRADMGEDQSAMADKSRPNENSARMVEPRTQTPGDMLEREAPARSEPAKAEAKSSAAAPAAIAPSAPPRPASARDVIGQGANDSLASSSSGSSLGGLRSRGGGSGTRGLPDLMRDSDDGAPAPTKPRPMEPSPEQQIAANIEAKVELFVRSVQGLSQTEAGAARGLRARAQRCYANASERRSESERLVIEMSINDKGAVADAYAAGGSLADRGAQACVLAAARALRFPKPAGNNASVSVGLTFAMGVASVATGPSTRPVVRRAPAKIPTPALSDAYDGVLAQTLAALERNDAQAARLLASAAHAQDPGDVLALVALGEALEKTNELERAARAYGSLIDLFPSRTDMRRMAAARLERLPAEAKALPLAVDSYRRAVAQRPDHPAGHRALAYALFKLGERAQAFEVLERALERHYNDQRFEGARRILAEDLALIGRAWLRADPSSEARVTSGLAAHAADADNKPSLRFVLSWETDANDVDFHIYDGRGGHAFYQKPKLASGGALYADITSGYGPECFTIPGKARAYPYVLQAHYFARGPMGFGMGKLQVIEHDGQGALTIDEHPFVIMKDKAFIELARHAGGGAVQAIAR
jgi:tetratricopeptide (TPR) repeat protein